MSHAPLMSVGSPWDFLADLKTTSDATNQAMVRNRNRVLSDGDGAPWSFREVTNVSRALQPQDIAFQQSRDRVGLALSELRLLEGAEGWLRNIWNESNEVYFVAWSWDYSGQKPVTYPGGGASASDCIIPMVAGDLRQFVGDGAVLFPARQISAGLAFRMMIWESDQGERDFGKAMQDVAGAVETSQLSSVLSLISTAGGIPVATLSLAINAAKELANVVGAILQANSDDYVDFFEGYFSVGSNWPAGAQRYTSRSSEITLNLLRERDDS